MDTERQETTRTVQQDTVDNGVTRRVRTVSKRSTSPLDLVRNIISFILGVIEVLLGIRFVLSLLGANRGNAFADFIYSITSPLVAPFRGLFNTQTTFGTARFEYEVLVAMLVYALLGWLITWLVGLNSPDVDAY